VVKGKDITAAGINAVMKAAANNDSFGYTSDPIVSSDVIGMSYGSCLTETQTRSARSTTTLSGADVAWYDNENSYTARWFAPSSTSPNWAEPSGK
jgi:glyceraldehyde 3-phosphate dehydrogenase